VRALTEANDGTLCQEITKNLLKTAPKILLQSHEQEGEEFCVCIKLRHDAALNPEPCKKWLWELTAKTKHCACKQIVQKACVGRHKGIETLA
jgi:hypothetical protein